MPRWFEPRDPEPPWFCVVGSPVRHSLSPRIHAAFAAACAIDLAYERVEVAAGSLAAALDEFRAAGGRGLNVTVPLKEEARALAEVCRPRAEAAGAANTLWFDAAGRTVADNTDGVGLVRDLERNLGLVLASARVLLLGAGGAARGVVPALLGAKVGELAISNRSADRAAAVAALFTADVAPQVVPWGQAPPFAPDLVLNATSLSLRGEVPPLPNSAIASHTVCYDMMYSSEPTAFMRWGEAAGAARAVDGIGMLVEQAAEAFWLWHRKRPATAAVIATLGAR